MTPLAFARVSKTDIVTTTGPDPDTGNAAGLGRDPETDMVWCVDRPFAPEIHACPARPTRPPVCPNAP